jgi:hypothetical protein
MSDSKQKSTGFSFKKILDRNSLFFGEASIVNVENVLNVIDSAQYKLPKKDDYPAVSAFRFLTVAYAAFRELRYNSIKSISVKGKKKLEMGCADILLGILKSISYPSETLNPNIHFNLQNNLYRFDIADGFIYFCVSFENEKRSEQNIQVYLSENIEMSDIVDFIWSKIGNYISIETTENGIKYKASSLSERSIFGSGSDICESLYKDKEFFSSRGISRGYLLVGPPGTGKSGTIRNFITKCGGKSIVMPDFMVTPHTAMAIIEFITMMSPDFVIFDDCDRAPDYPSYIRSGLDTIDSIRESCPGITLLFAANKFSGILLDDAFIRSGRIDKIIEVPLPDEKDRRTIIEEYIKYFDLDSSKISLDDAVNRSKGMSGADLRELCITAMKSEAEDFFTARATANKLKDKYKERREIV